MPSIWDGIGGILGWFSPEQRTKAKRARVDFLKKEIDRLENGPCNDATVAKVQKYKEEKARLETDLKS